MAEQLKDNLEDIKVLFALKQNRRMNYNQITVYLKIQKARLRKVIDRCVEARLVKEEGIRKTVKTDGCRKGRTRALWYSLTEEGMKRVDNHAFLDLNEAFETVYRILEPIAGNEEKLTQYRKSMLELGRKFERRSRHPPDVPNSLQEWKQWKTSLEGYGNVRDQTYQRLRREKEWRLLEDCAKLLIRIFLAIRAPRGPDGTLKSPYGLILARDHVWLFEPSPTLGKILEMSSDKGEKGKRDVVFQTPKDGV